MQMPFFNMANFNPNVNSVKCPFKCIMTRNNINGINNPSFINSALQSFACIKCINLWINNLYQHAYQINSNQNMQLTKEIFKLFSSLYNGQIPDSSNFIYQYLNKQYIINQQDPYHFLFYLIQLLHDENNRPMNLNYDATVLNRQSIENRRNKTYMRNLFAQFLQQSQNSIFSKNFFNILGNKFSCDNCQDTFNDSYRYIIKFPLDEYRNYRNMVFPCKTNTNITLDDCFVCYTGENIKQCLACGNFNYKTYTSFFSPANILIIALIRKNHSFKCDIDFPIKFNINNYLEIGRNINKYYILKACVSLNNQGIYFSDICMNNYWFRFYLQNFILLGNAFNDIQYIHQFEPQLLFYEIEG